MNKARDLVVPQVTLAKVRTVVAAVVGGAADETTLMLLEVAG